MTQQQFDSIIKSRAKKHTSGAFRFFWASFVFQIALYALLSHVLIRNFGDGLIMVPATVGIILYIPFTAVLISKFKRIALLRDLSINAFVQKQYNLLESFYRFKRRYELMLIPMACMIGTFITFQLYVPGSYIKTEIITFFISLASCLYAIRAENKKSFDIPLSKLRMILDDLNANVNR